MALFSRLTVVRTLPEGHGISYGGTYVTDHPTRVATVGHRLCGRLPAFPGP